MVSQRFGEPIETDNTKTLIQSYIYDTGMILEKISWKWYDRQLAKLAKFY